MQNRTSEKRRQIENSKMRYIYIYIFFFFQIKKCFMVRKCDGVVKVSYFIFTLSSVDGKLSLLGLGISSETAKNNQELKDT